MTTVNIIGYLEYGWIQGGGWGPPSPYHEDPEILVLMACNPAVKDIAMYRWCYCDS